MTNTAVLPENSDNRYHYCNSCVMEIISNSVLMESRGHIVLSRVV